jgi:hypothetical protein
MTDAAVLQGLSQQMMDSLGAKSARGSPAILTYALLLY